MLGAQKRVAGQPQRFARGLLATLVPGLMALAALQVYFERQINRKAEYLEPLASLGAAEVLVLGDSHAKDAFGREVLTRRIHSVAHGQDSLKEDYLKARLLLARPNGLRYIVVQRDPHVIAGYRLASNNKFRTFYFADHEDINRLYQAKLSPVKQRLFTALPIAYTENRAEAAEVLIAHAATVLERRGAAPAADEGAWARMSPERRRSEAKARIGRQFRFGVVEQQLVDILREIVDLAHSSGLEVIGLGYPLSREYLSELSTHRDQVAAALKGIGVDHILDYGEVFADRPDLFLDQDHVNAAGARELNDLFLGDLDRLARPAGPAGTGRS